MILPWSNRSDRVRALEAEGDVVALIESGNGNEPGLPRKRRVSEGHAGAVGDGCFERRWDSWRCSESEG